MRAPRNNQAKGRKRGSAKAERLDCLLEALLEARQPWFDDRLQLCSAIEPQWVERVRALPAVQELIAARVPEAALLRALALVRFYSGSKTLRSHTREFEHAAAQLEAAATALARLPNPPPAAFDPSLIPVWAATSKALRALQRPPPAAFDAGLINPTPAVSQDADSLIDLNALPPAERKIFDVMGWLLCPKSLAGALRTLAENYRRLIKELKPRALSRTPQGEFF
jgi:hypothetical protein